MRSGTQPRVAWFTPLPPVRSGIARYSAETLAVLDLACDVFVDGAPGDILPPSAHTVVRSAHDFVWLHAQRPYDLVVYQLGNATCHDYMWGYLARYPGLVVLHDGQIHQARGRLLRAGRRHDDYQAELRFAHPGIGDAVTELAIAGRLFEFVFLWPMRRVVVESARLVAVHNRYLADEIERDHPGARVAVVEMGVPDTTAVPDAGAMIRARHGIPHDAVIFAALGEVTPEKRIPAAIRQLAAIAREVPGAHLLLAGSPSAHYDAVADARRHGVAERVTVAGYVPHEDIAAYLAAADVCLCLRWPTSRETSAAWLRCLAAGKPTIVTDLAHTADVPVYDPRSWSVQFAASAGTDASGWPTKAGAAAVALDILDEEHSLRLAMHRLATDARLRERLGREARALWERRFTLAGMASSYRELIARAASAPLPAAPQPDLPEHFHRDGTAYASRLLREMGIDEPTIAGIWRPAAQR